MPAQHGLRPDDGYGVKDGRTATIEPDEQSTIDPSQMRSTWRALLQNIELMPQRQNLGLQLLSRLEAVTQQADEQEPQRNHAAMMF
jgi:hypothetical protein